MRAHRWLGVLVAAHVFLAAMPARAGAGENSFTPVSLRSPILSVMLYSEHGAPASADADADAGEPSDGGSEGGALTAPTRPQSLYTCAAMKLYEEQRSGGEGPGAEAGVDGGAPLTLADVQAACMVDLADNSALQALFAGDHPIEAAIYDSIRVQTCVAEDYQIQIKGVFELAGTTHHTVAGPDPLALGGENADYVTVTHHGCSFSYGLPTPTRVNAGDNVTVNALFSIKDIAWGELRSAKSGMGGCGVASAGGHGVCTSYTNIVPYIGTVVPTLETYHVTTARADLVDLDNPIDTHASGQVLLVVDDAGGMIGGFTRRLLSEQSESGLSFDSPLKPIVMTPGTPPTYVVENFGSTSDGPGYLKMAQFKRATHSGTMEFPQDGNPSILYGAVKQP